VDEIDQFRITLQQLEICRELVLNRGETGSRVALILLDNVCETICYRLIRSEFDRDDFRRSFVEERYLPKLRHKIERTFAAKIEAVRKAHRLPAQVATTLLILHSYRNAAYHRDTHNPVVIPLLARIALVAVADLFARTRGGIQISAAGGHKSPIDWLQLYGYQDTFIDFSDAARVVARALKKKIRPTFPKLVEGFMADIASRVASIRQVLAQHMLVPNVSEIDRMLKWFEFRHMNPYLESNLSASYRALNYRIAAGGGDEITPGEYEEARTSFRTNYETAHDKYLPTLTHAVLAEIENDLQQQLSIAKNYRGALNVYSQLDALVTRYEEVSWAANREIEYQSAMESDIQRGK
jgi:hypothetical protein